MKVEAHKQGLTGLINIAQEVVPGRIPLPVLEGIYSKTENSQITFMGTDGEISIRSIVAAKAIEEGEIVLGSRLFGGIIRKPPSATICLALTKHNLNIRCQQSEFDIMGQSIQEFPQAPEINNPVKIRLAKESLADFLRSTSFTVSLDDLRIALTGVLLDCKPGRMSFVVLDGYRIALNKLEIQSDAEIQATVPARACAEIIRLSDDLLDTVLTELADNYIKINLGSTTFVSKLINEEFFQRQGLVRNDRKTNIKLRRQDFVQDLERANLLAKEERSNLVRLDTSTNGILIESHLDIGDVYELIPCTTKGEGSKMASNSGYLLEGVKAIQEEEIIRHFIDSVNPCIVESSEKSGYVYLVLPVRLAGQQWKR